MIVTLEQCVFSEIQVTKVSFCASGATNTNYLTEPHLKKAAKRCYTLITKNRFAENLICH